jgi:hypothetical protein
MLIGGQDMNRKEKLSLEKCYLSSLICVEFVFEYQIRAIPNCSLFCFQICISLPQRIAALELFLENRWEERCRWWTIGFNGGIDGLPLKKHTRICNDPLPVSVMYD